MWTCSLLWVGSAECVYSNWPMQKAEEAQSTNNWCTNGSLWTTGSPMKIVTNNTWQVSLNKHVDTLGKRKPRQHHNHNNNTWIKMCNHPEKMDWPLQKNHSLDRYNGVLRKGGKGGIKKIKNKKKCKKKYKWTQRWKRRTELSLDVMNRQMPMRSRACSKTGFLQM